MYTFSKIFYWLVFKLFFRFEVVGAKNEPLDGKVIVASNHLSNLDPPVIAAALKRYVHFLGKVELFKNPILSWYIKQHNTHPVKRGKGDAGAMRTCIKVLNEGNALTIFPQGSRGRAWEKAGDGVAFLAKKTGAKVLPLRIYGSDKILPKGSAFIHFFTKLKVVVGEPIEIGENEELKDFTKRLTKAITSL